MVSPKSEPAEQPGKLQQQQEQVEEQKPQSIASQWLEFLVDPSGTAIKKAARSDVGKKIGGLVKKGIALAGEIR